MFNIGSLILGISAWLFAGLAIIVPETSKSHRNTMASFSLCVFALLLQLFEINRRVLLGDYAAIEDTIHAILIASVALVFITIILNLIVFVKAKIK